MFKKIINALIDQPVLGSLFVADFFLVFFVKNAHWFFTSLMLGSLAAMCLYYGQKLQLFNIPTDLAEKAD